MGRILSHIPGFRSGNPRHMVLAGAYYAFALSMTLVSAALGFLLLSGPFLLFNGFTSFIKYNESKDARALTALFLSAAICGGSLIGFVVDMTGRQQDAPEEIVAALYTELPSAASAETTSPVTAPPPSPSPAIPAMERAIVLGYTADGLHVQYTDESPGDTRLSGIEIEEGTDAAGFMGETLPPGSLVYLETDTDGAAYYIWLEEPLLRSPDEVRRKTLNALLVANGYACAAGTPGTYAGILAACQEEAEAARLGLWALPLETMAAAPDAPKPAPEDPSTPEPDPSLEETEQAPAPAPEDPPSEPPPGGVYYCGSKQSDVFHLSTCGSASQISPENLVIYGSREEAIQKGKRPCKKCNP